MEENKTKSEVLEYLTEKYGEEFEITDIARRNIAIPYNETAVFPKKNPELVFTVREENGQFVDSYYGVLIETEYNLPLTSSRGKTTQRHNNINDNEYMNYMNELRTLFKKNKLKSN